MQYKENHLSEKLNLKIGFKILFILHQVYWLRRVCPQKVDLENIRVFVVALVLNANCGPKADLSLENSVTIYVLSATMEANNPCEVVSLYSITKFMFGKESTMDDILLKHFIRQDKYSTDWNVLEIQDDLKNQTSFLRFQNLNGASYPTL